MAMPQKSKSQVTVTAIERALKILEILQKENREMGVNEIAEMLGEYQSTVYRAIYTLESRGYICQNPHSNKYALGLKLYLMGKTVAKKSVVLNVVEPYVRSIAEEFNETVNVAIPDETKEGFRATTIYQVKSHSRVLSPTETVGQSFECTYSSVGKAIMAFSERATWEMVQKMHFHPYTPNTIVDAQVLWEELEEIRRRGYAVDNEEQELGLFCVGCPVLDVHDQAILAISVSGFVGNMKAIGVERIAKRLKQVCGELSRIMI